MTITEAIQDSAPLSGPMPRLRRADNGGGWSYSGAAIRSGRRRSRAFRGRRAADRLRRVSNGAA